MSAYIDPVDDRIVVIDGCTSPAEVARVLEACAQIKGVVIIGVDPARGTDMTAVVAMRRQGETIELISARQFYQEPEAADFEKSETPRPVEAPRRRIWEGMKRIAGADIRRFLPRRT